MSYYYNCHLEYLRDSEIILFVLYRFTPQKSMRSGHTENCEGIKGMIRIMRLSMGSYRNKQPVNSAQAVVD